MLPSWCRDTITVTRAPWKESRGSKVRDWANAKTHTVTGCSVQYDRTATNGASARAQATSTTAVIYCAPGSDVLAGDRVQFGNAKFEVEGEPFEVRSPFGGCDHILVDVVARRG